MAAPAVVRDRRGRFDHRSPVKEMQVRQVKLAIMMVKGNINWQKIQCGHYTHLIVQNHLSMLFVVVSLVS